MSLIKGGALRLFSTFLYFVAFCCSVIIVGATAWVCATSPHSQRWLIICNSSLLASLDQSETSRSSASEQYPWRKMTFKRYTVQTTNAYQVLLRSYAPHMLSCRDWLLRICRCAYGRCLRRRNDRHRGSQSGCSLWLPSWFRDDVPPVCRDLRCGYYRHLRVLGQQWHQFCDVSPWADLVSQALQVLIEACCFANAGGRGSTLSGNAEPLLVYHGIVFVCRVSERASLF